MVLHALLPGRGLMTHPAVISPWVATLAQISRLSLGMGHSHTGEEPHGVVNWYMAYSKTTQAS